MGGKGAGRISSSTSYPKEGEKEESGGASIQFDSLNRRSCVRMGKVITITTRTNTVRFTLHQFLSFSSKTIQLNFFFFEGGTKTN